MTTTFALGQIVATPGALAALQENDLAAATLLARHVRGDWGTLSPADAALNDASVTSGDRILSNYPLADGSRIWIITEADRSASTLLLPEEY